MHQLAPDGNIYIPVVDLDDWPNGAINHHLSAIVNPDLPGTACDFQLLHTYSGPRPHDYDLPFHPNYYLGPLARQAEAGPSDTSLCVLDSIQIGIPDSSGNLLFHWSPPLGLSDTSIAQPWLSVSTDTKYILTLTDTSISAACGNVSQDTIFVHAEPVQVTPILGNVESCPGEEIQLGPDSRSGLHYSWSPPEHFSNPGQSPAFYSVPDSGLFQLVLSTTDSSLHGSCVTKRDTLLLYADDCLDPNIVSPNHDGINDVLWFGEYFGNQGLEIYTRWGELIYKNSQYQNNWPGDVDIKEGVYYYVHTPPQPLKVKTGFVVVVR